MNDRIYFVSQYDNCVHNINDVEYQIIGEDKAHIGKDCGEEGFRVDEEVNLWTIKEIANFYDNKKIKESINMTVLEKMKELKKEGYQEIWIQKENDYEYMYGLYGYSSIENQEYIEMNKEIFSREVKEAQKINNRIARIIY